MKTSNPVLNDAFPARSWGMEEKSVMTVNGVVLKTALLLVITLLSAAFTWRHFAAPGADLSALNGWMLGSIFVGFGVAMATVFKKTWSPVTAPLYAAVEGVFVGAISMILEASFPGIALQAATATFGTLAAMLFVYQSGLIKVTDTFRMIVATATLGIAATYFLMIVLAFFGVNISFLTDSGGFSILFSLFVIGIAALNFVLDFDAIEQGAARGAPKYMEWFGAFALMVTIIWLYIEFLRLLSKLRSR
ncbi:MAG: Bax inhibitor-1/YccA family protein [Chlamydiia bacterium]|nr:Bax inhibitor-1/YccA family protein [Chlamydiia bacterium]